jgi:hypothetical protein
VKYWLTEKQRCSGDKSKMELEHIMDFQHGIRLSGIVQMDENNFC